MGSRKNRFRPESQQQTVRWQNCRRPDDTCPEWPARFSELIGLPRKAHGAFRGTGICPQGSVPRLARWNTPSIKKKDLQPSEPLGFCEFGIGLN